MAGVANITIVGNLTRDPETRYTPNGRMNVTFSVAVNRRRGETETVNFYRVTAWGKLAEVLDRLSSDGVIEKGRQVFVSGSFEARDYQAQDGTTRTSLDVNAIDVQVLGARDVEGNNTAITDDVPF